MSSTKTILIAHRQAEVRDRFAAALADARHAYVLADSAEAACRAVSESAVPISLALVDLSLVPRGSDLVRGVRDAAGRSLPVAVFAGSVASAGEIPELAALHVAGYVNEHAATSQILPALAPHLFPDNFDRRASRRVPLGVAVTYQAGATIAVARALNIGKGGLALRTLTPLQPDTPIVLRFALSGASDEIDISGRVAWADRKIGMGILFERTEPDDAMAVEKFVDG